MRLTKLRVENFRCISHVDLDLDADWVVIYGPNDLGKSTLANAIRMALLGRIGSTIWDEYEPWGSTAKPEICLDFRLPDEQATYRVTKTPRSALLQRRADGGSQFHDERRDKGVNERLFGHILKWGLGPPGKYQGMASSFIAELLFAEQDKVSWILSGDAKGVGEDKTESAREWLTQALEAKALDPEFRSMLENVAKRCGVFFTHTGRFRRGADSPIRTLQEEVEAVRQRKAALEGQWESMSGVRDEHRENTERLSALKEEIVRLEERRDRAVEDQKLRDAYESARSAWETAAERARRIEETTSKLEQKRRELEALEETIRGLTQRIQTAGEGLTQAKEELRSLESGTTDVDKERRRGELRGKLGETRTKLQTLDHGLERAKTTLGRWRNVRRAAEESDRLATEQSELNEELTTKRAYLIQTKQKLRRRQSLDAQARLAETSVALSDLEKRSAEASTVVEDTARELSEVGGALEGLPDSATMQTLADLQRDVAVARGKLSVGLALELRLVEPRTVAATIDNERQDARTVTSVQWHADRTATLHIDGVGELVVRAGDIEEHAELARLEADWREKAVPLLARTDADSIDELRVKRTGLEARSRELETQRERATRDAPNAAESDELRREVGRLQEELVSLGNDLGVDQGEPLPPAAELQTRVESLDGEVDRLERKEEVLRSRLADAGKDLTERSSEAGDDIEELASKAELLVEGSDAQRQELTKDVADIERLLQELDGAHATELAEARRKVVEGENGVRELNSTRDGRVAKRNALSTEIATTQGELNSAREGFEPDEATRLRVKLDITPRPSGDTAENVDGIDTELGRARRGSGELEREIATLAGHIQSATGPSAEEELQELNARLHNLEDQEKELLTDAHGWQLLDEIMKQVEASEAGNLGASVIPLIEPRIHEIVGPRYSLAVDPTLAGSGAVNTPGGLQELSKISVGTREQIATLFRLALAERLRSTVVLDDQLVQSDHARMDKLRAILRDVSQRAQILVFTCRPEEYRVEGATMIDLERLSPRPGSATG